MAALVDHIAQAKHNENLAEKLDTPTGLTYRDWLITIAFYAAVHYVEAFFTTTSIGHTDIACPDASPHQFRQSKVEQYLGKNCYKSYRKLRIASHNVRYLPVNMQQGLGTDYYTPEDAQKFFRQELKAVRDAVGQHINLTDSPKTS